MWSGYCQELSGRVKVLREWSTIVRAVSLFSNVFIVNSLPMLLEELQVYQLSMILSDQMWEKVAAWDYFARDTIGKQLEQPTPSQLMSVRVTGGIIIKRILTSAIIHVVLFRKQKPGLQKHSNGIYCRSRITIVCIPNSTP